MHVFGYSLGCDQIWGNETGKWKPVGTTERYDQISRSDSGRAASRDAAAFAGMQMVMDALDIQATLGLAATDVKPWAASRSIRQVDLWHFRSLHPIRFRFYLLHQRQGPRPPHS